MKKRFLGSVLVSFVAIATFAQVSNTLSPYSQFGLGTLAEQSQGFNRGMGGLAIGLRSSRQVNVLNPASYSAIDSLTMVFDLGVSGQLTNFKEGKKRVNAQSADFDYAVALFRVLPHLGASVGVIPYSNIGYNYYNSEEIDGNGVSAASSSDGYYSNTYNGSGGFSQAFFGLGWEFVRGLSIGANISYFWGKYDKTVVSTFNDSYANTLTKTYQTTVNSWKLDVGAQWTARLGKTDRLTIGATAGIGHKLGADAKLSIVNTNTPTGVTTSTVDSVANGLSIPFTFGGGFSLFHRNRLTVGADYQLQRWSALKYPQFNESSKRYVATNGLLLDRHKVTVGADWIPNPTSRHFLSHVHYRVGGYYATPYYKIGHKDGPQEYGVSAGFGIPIVNSWNNRSTLNVSAQWVHSSATTLVTENTFRINIGLTFNERWFAKWKVD